MGSIISLERFTCPQKLFPKGYHELDGKPFFL